ncbi:MAG: hypothetical protein M0Z84_06880 [Gammaproteobacteria bacterium]|nr:hypothetical protein [Gammaproteobacteria bacterium]
MPAHHGAPQRKVRAQVLARRCLGLAEQAVLDGSVGLKADKGLMVTLAQGNAPVRGFDIAGIHGPLEQIGHPLRAHFAAPVARILRVRREESLHFRLELEAARGIAFERFLDDGGQRLGAD